VALLPIAQVAGGGAKVMKGTIFRELILVLRTLRQHWGFSLMCVLLLALGIGTSTVMFTVVDSALIHALPFRASARMVQLRTHWTRDNGGTGPLSYPDFLDLKKQTRVFDEVAVYRTDDFTISTGAEPSHARGAVVSSNLFALLGVKPYLGRDFVPQEDSLQGTGSSFPIILSYSLWRDKYGADARVVGSDLTVGGTPFTVVGIMPKDFMFPLPPEQPDFWVSMAFDLKSSEIATERDSHYLNSIGLLKPGTAIQIAQQNINVIMANLAEQYPDSNHDKIIMLADERDALIGDRRSQLIILCFAVACVLLISCVNVAALMLARSANQEKEFAIRLALGATRRRIWQQVLFQSLLLAFAGAFLGIVGARWGTVAFLAMLKTSIATSHLNPEVFAFEVAISLASAVVCAMIPALNFSWTNSSFVMGGSRTMTGGRKHKTIRNSLIVVEVTLAVVIMAQAGLLWRSLEALSHVDTGFKTEGVLTFQLQFPSSQYTDAQRNQTVDSVLERIKHLPGVLNASSVSPLPLSGNNIAAGFRILGDQSSKRIPIADFYLVAPGYFQTMGINTLQGRSIEPKDVAANDQPVALINQALALRYFPNQDPIGHSIRALVSTGSAPPSAQNIIGVVKDVRARDLRSDAKPQIYLPYSKLDFDVISIVIKANIDPYRVVDTIRNEIKRVEPNLAPYNFMPLQEYVLISMAKLRFSLLILAIFAIISLFLTTVGLYGVISYSVAQEVRALGIRLALGAQSNAILKLVLWRGLKLVLPGIAAGFVATMAVSKMASAMLFHVQPYDPVTFIGVAIVVAIVSIFASYTPARKAAAIDPAVTLRAE
jgi:putative ABC transport system permease protein